MLAIDTNVVIRYLTGDHPKQSAKTRALIDNEDVFVSTTVLLETEWVLRSRYDLKKNEIVEAVSGLLDATEIRLEDEPAVEETLFVWKDSAADFADCLIGAHNRRLGCRATATFDTKAVKLPDFVVI